jgi:GAF domain
VSKEIYQQVLELAATSQDEETRFWQVTQAIFENALQHLDSEHQGLAVTYAKLMPPHIDGIHSLREVTMRGHAPWPARFDSKVYLGNTTLAGSCAVLQRLQVWNNTEDNRSLVEIDEHEHSACAVPIVRGSRIAGVLIVSSNQADFFKNQSACQAVNEYALLMGVAISDREFQPASLLHLRPMPDLHWQRQQLMQNYVDRIITYARTHSTSRREAEFFIQHELELEFEEKARTILEKKQGIV